MNFNKPVWQTRVMDAKSPDDEIQGMDLEKIFAISSAKKIIRNYINIVSGTNKINLNIKRTGSSYTDGKSVVVGSDIKDSKNIPSAIGLAMHEASHIRYTNFDRLWDKLVYWWGTIAEKYPDVGYSGAVHLKEISNFIEDRRIDGLVLQNFPGYHQYYEALYDKYIRIPGSLDEYIAVYGFTFDLYIAGLLSLINPKADCSKLPGLNEIEEKLDLARISRLTSLDDSIELSVQILDIIYSNLAKLKAEEQNRENKSNLKAKEPMGGDAEPSNDDENPEDGASGDSDQSNEDALSNDEKSEGGSNNASDGEDAETADGEDAETADGEGENGIDSDLFKPTKISKSKKAKLEKALASAKLFGDGEIKKTGVSKMDENAINSIDIADAELRVVAGTDGLPKVKNFIIRETSEKLRDIEQIRDYILGKWDRFYRNRHIDAINAGFQLGKQLGSRIRIAGEKRETVWTRQRKGALDKRLIASLGYGAENVFSQSEITAKKPSFIHISIDASGSMCGIWDSTIKTAAAIAKAATMLPNFDVQISLRYASFKLNAAHKNVVVTPIVYDSRKHNLIDLRENLSLWQAEGYTPEGLSFEGLLPELQKAANSDANLYFINLSDGSPGMILRHDNGDRVNYGTEASHYKYIQRQVNAIRKSGFKILSYFISGDSAVSEKFEFMYGKESSAILNSANLPVLLKTINKLIIS